MNFIGNPVLFTALKEIENLLVNTVSLVFTFLLKRNVICDKFKLLTL